MQSPRPGADAAGSGAGWAGFFGAGDVAVVFAGEVADAAAFPEVLWAAVPGVAVAVVDVDAVGVRVASAAAGAAIAGAFLVGAFAVAFPGVGLGHGQGSSRRRRRAQLPQSVMRSPSL